MRVRFGIAIHDLSDLGARRWGRRTDVLVDASGARCSLLASLGFSNPVALRSARALCLVISLRNGKSREEYELREVCNPN